MCAEGGPLNKDRYFVRELELLGRTLRIYQECLSDVGGVVWDSAIVASHYFVREKDYWKNKQVLELGCGTGVCSIVLAVLGANVIATDLPERLPLLQLNISANESVLGEGGGSIKIEALNWEETNFSPSCFDVIILVDLLYYIKVAREYSFQGVESLIRIIRTLRASELLCIYEERDIGEAYLAQKRFFELAPLYFHLSAVPQIELDPVFSDPSISVIRLRNKEVFDFKIVRAFEQTASSKKCEICQELINTF
uniref:Uncharacterized protein n=1 Tax=Ascaris lumbricoides TaxID=6252 RepID=A0A9J2PQ88_ASCLU